MPRAVNAHGAGAVCKACIIFGICKAKEEMCSRLPCFSADELPFCPLLLSASAHSVYDLKAQANGCVQLPETCCGAGTIMSKEHSQQVCFARHKPVTVEVHTSRGPQTPSAVLVAAVLHLPA